MINTDPKASLWIQLEEGKNGNGVAQTKPLTRQVFAGLGTPCRVEVPVTVQN